MSNNPFWDQQQKLFDQWNENMSKLPGMSAYTDMFKNMMPGADQYWNQFSNMASNMPKYWENMSKMMPNPATYWENITKMMPGMNNMMPNADMFSKMMPFQIPGMDSMTKLFDLWKGLGNPATFVQDFGQKYMDLMQDMFKNFLPAGGAQFMEKPQQLLDTCMTFYKQFFQPWMQIDDDIIQRCATGDFRAWQDFFKAFSERYDETFDKLFNMMGMGLNREANEDYMHAINAFFKAIFATGEMMTLVLEACQKSAQGLVDRYQANLSEGKMVTTFREFYNLWYSVTEEYLTNLFDTDEFAKAFGEFGDKYAQYMIAMNKVYERQLAALPIPTNTDMKSLYRTVYDLRKDVRDLRRDVDALKADAAKK